MFLPVYLLLDSVFVASEVTLARWRHSTREAKAQEADGGSLRRLWLIIPGALIAGHWLAMVGAGPRLPGAGLPWWQFGATVFAAGTALRWWSIVHLGRFFTVDVAIAADQRVVDTGPYRAVRHPSYTGLLAQVLGIALTLGHVLTAAVIFVPICFVLWRRILVEEAALCAGLGPPYIEYMRRTKRLVPGLI